MKIKKERKKNCKKKKKKRNNLHAVNKQSRNFETLQATKPT